MLLEYKSPPSASAIQGEIFPQLNTKKIHGCSSLRLDSEANIFFFWKGNQTITRPFSHEEYYGTQKKATLQFCNLC